MCRKIKQIFLIIFSCLLLTRCSSLQSGQYVQLQSFDSVESLSKEFGVSKESIIQANRLSRFNQGDWVFIPLKRGVIAHLREEVQALEDDSSSPQENFWNSKLLWPLPSSYKVTSDFGIRNSKNHKGIDIKGYKGDSIVAAEDGIVIYSGNKLRGYGNLTIIYHGEDLYTVYAHAQKNYTKKGDKVYRGQIIATVGNTGKSTGSHLHFEVRHGHVAKSPLEFFRF